MMIDQPNPSTDSPAKPRNMVTLIAAVAVLGVMVVAGALVIIDRRFGHKPDSGSAATPAPSAPVASAPITSPKANCPSDTAQTPPAQEPADVHWEAMGPLVLPYGGTKYGPCAISTTTATGYAHSPAGALIAAAQITGRSSTTDPVAVAVETIRTQFVASDDRDRMLTHTQSVAGRRMTSDQVGAFAAYAITSYSSDTTILQLAERGNALPGQYIVLSIILRWIDGDWRMVAPPSGDWSNSARMSSTLDGFVAWGVR